jgi:periplasmic divalent cation tolerance protein
VPFSFENHSFDEWEISFQFLRLHEKERRMNHDYSMIIATFPDKGIAKKTAKLLVEKRLAACVQLFPIESIYRWKDEICDENEIMLFIKSRTDMFAKITSAIKANHLYEVPEIIQVPISAGLPEYLQWIGDCTNER